MLNFFKIHNQLICIFFMCANWGCQSILASEEATKKLNHSISSSEMDLLLQLNQDRQSAYVKIQNSIYKAHKPKEVEWTKEFKLEYSNAVDQMKIYISESGLKPESFFYVITKLSNSLVVTANPFIQNIDNSLPLNHLAQSRGIREKSFRGMFDLETQIYSEIGVRR